MEKSLCTSREMVVDKSVLSKNIYTSRKGINRSKNIKKSDNVFPNVGDVRNIFFFRNKRISSCVGDDDFNDKLSNELILLIFKWLPKKDLIQCTMVCKRWREITYNEILWNNLDLCRKTLSEITLQQILSKGVRILRLAQAKIITSVIKEANNHFDNDYTYKLQYLDISMAMILPDNLANLLSKCKHLKKLSLESCTLNAACCKELSYCTKLSVLNLGMCEGIDLKGVLHILKLRSLIELNVAWCSLDKEPVTILCKMLPPTIVRFNISGSKEIIDHNVEELVKSCPDMIELDLSDCTVLTDKAISNILNLTKLEHLSLSRCYNISALSYLELEHMPRIEYLDIFNMLPKSLPKKLKINNFLFSSIARPTIGNQSGTIWGLQVRN
ncbi:S-phase kinase-associated protein 2-like isoform X1 [Vespa velutina]|uniref:S-phase kinase-associated protein 2-like isoform X1 n=1 Tax=Vespa velutina TaxID=202808 RepID=UPI001FB4EF89|nr:S-phase kinase-associated protein 2-like isoform X1 [Vespa velutina]